MVTPNSFYKFFLRSQNATTFDLSLLGRNHQSILVCLNLSEELMEWSVLNIVVSYSGLLLTKVFLFPCLEITLRHGRFYLPPSLARGKQIRVIVFFCYYLAENQRKVLLVCKCEHISAFSCFCCFFTDCCYVPITIKKHSSLTTLFAQKHSLLGTTQLTKQEIYLEISMG